MSHSHLVGLSSAPLNATLDDYHDACARLIWDVHAAKNLGPDMSHMLKHSEGRDVIYAAPMWSEYVRNELIDMTLDEQQKDMLAERLELRAREPIEAGKNYVCAPEYDPNINKKITGFVADATVKSTIYDASFMAYDRGDSEQDIRDLNVQKRLIAAMKIFRKEHMHDDVDALNDYFTNPVHVLHSMGLLNDPPAPEPEEQLPEIEQQRNADEITRPTPTTSRPVIVLKNSETSPQKPKPDRCNHP